MAAYAIGESGEQEGFQFLEKIFKAQSGLSSFFNMAMDQKHAAEFLKLPDTLNSAFDLYNSSYYADAKEKFLKIMQLYSCEIPRMNVPHFDDLVQYVAYKTRGLLLDGLAVCEFNLGNIDEALRYSMEAVTIAEEVRDPQLLKIAYADLGHFHIALGNYYSALELFHKSLEIDDTSNDPWRKRNRILSNLSHLYYQIGHYDNALEYGQEALELSERENDLNGKARCLNALGVIFSSVDEYEDAEECLQEALRLTTDELNNNALQSLILNNIACVYSMKSDTEKARECLSKALDLAVQIKDKSAEGNIRLSLAMLELDKGNIDNAWLQSQAALEIFKEIYSPSGESDARYLLGSIDDIFNDNLLAAYEHYKEAIRLSETMRENLMLDDFKISFGGNHVTLYQQMVSLCIRLGKAEEAFEYIERSKSRAFVDMLSSTSNSISAKELPQEKLDEIATLKGRLDFLRRQISTAYSDVNKEASDVRQEDIAAEIIDLERAYLRTFEDIKMKDPEWISLVSVEVANIKAVQRRLNETTALLEFYQSGDDIIVLVIRNNKPPSVVKVPVDIEVESDRLSNLFMSLSGRCGVGTRSHEFIKEIKKPLSYFYDLLISPLQKLIEDAKHLIIIPHHFWHYLPFHALYDNDAKQYIIDKFSISYAPSATALCLCFKESEKTYSSAVIFANPSGDLSFAEDEGKAIYTKFDKANLVIREKATIDKLSETGDTDVVHLACHGYFREDAPLFSHIVLADEEGKASPFFMPDIFNLRLNASLVTLSACETGLSQFTAGDELIGIARAFFYAGTPSLLSSLWTVNDRSTALLMDKFYDKLVNNGEKAAALRFAMQKLKAMPEYSHPYFWAPFFLSGDWR
jgi:CHAT domain-containing protein/Tfp pilus assembly protein PilF